MSSPKVSDISIYPIYSFLHPTMTCIHFCKNTAGTYHFSSFEYLLVYTFLVILYC